MLSRCALAFATFASSLRSVNLDLANLSPDGITHNSHDDAFLGTPPTLNTCLSSGSQQICAACLSTSINRSSPHANLTPLHGNIAISRRLTLLFSSLAPSQTNRFGFCTFRVDTHAQPVSWYDTVMTYSLLPPDYPSLVKCVSGAFIALGLLFVVPIILLIGFDLVVWTYRICRTCPWSQPQEPKHPHLKISPGGQPAPEAANGNTAVRKRM